MKKYTEIMAILKEQGAEVRAMEERLRGIRFERGRDEEYAELAASMERLTIERKIWHDNARRAAAAEFLPVALDILEKYEGKPYGEKTRQKISDEVKAATGFRFYISTRYAYTHELILSPDSYEFKYDDFCIIGEYNEQERERARFLVDNKIQRINRIGLRLCDCAEYVDDAEAHAQKIMDEFAKLKVQYEAMESACKQFNELLPSGMERKSTRDFRNYLM